MSQAEQEEPQEKTLPIDWHFSTPQTFQTITGPLPGGRRLSRRLTVVIKADDEEIVVSEPRFHLHAVGTTLSEALTEFRRILSEELDELTADEEELGPRLQAELQYLRDLIRAA
jgi:hypothetical protein